jgi:hypothetical protein
VAIYASQADEPTVELPLLKKSGKKKEFCGLLTFTLTSVLNHSESRLTYTELVQGVHSAYVDILGRVGPTPLVEGNDREREVLGSTEWSGRSRIVIQAGENDEIEVTAGSLQGLTLGSIFAVYPPPGAKNADKKLGHVRLTDVGTVRSRAEPCKHDGLAEPEERALRVSPPRLRRPAAESRPRLPCGYSRPRFLAAATRRAG